MSPPGWWPCFLVASDKSTTKLRICMLGLQNAKDGQIMANLNASKSQSITLLTKLQIGSLSKWQLWAQRTAQNASMSPHFSTNSHRLRVEAVSIYWKENETNGCETNRRGLWAIKLQSSSASPSGKIIYKSIPIHAQHAQTHHRKISLKV